LRHLTEIASFNCFIERDVYVIPRRVVRSDVTTAQKSEDWQIVIDYYSVVFESFASMNVAFKVISH